MKDVCEVTQTPNGLQILHIGQPRNDALDFTAAGSGSDFYGPVISWEYTANSIVFWPDRSIIIDITGTGVEDVCAQQIRIPVSESSWDTWNDPNNTRKLYRFWKLRVKNFMPFNDATRDYIVTEAQAAIQRNGERDFKRFYCSTVYGSTYLEDKNVCQVGDSMTCTSLSQQYDSTLRQDMGSEYIVNLGIPACKSITIAM